MARHFLGLFILIVATLAAVSWAQDRLLQGTNNLGDEDATLKVTAALLATELKKLPESAWKERIGELSAKSGSNLEVFNTRDIAGADALERLNRGEVVRLTPARETWAMLRLDDDHLVVFKSHATNTRDWLDWAATGAFYATIALVLMLWIWPLARDLRALEAATAQYGNRNWRFDANISPYSQIFPLAESFRKMAARIDQLIESHKDMSNALSHEIKTPLSRMKFELEFAQSETELPAIRASLDHLLADVDAINRLTRSMLEYAVLERAEFELNIAEHNFETVLSSVTSEIARELSHSTQLQLNLHGPAGRVRCDAYLMETIVKNLIYNAARYARSKIHVSFRSDNLEYRLSVEDDGPGIPEDDSQRVFGAFVKLDRSEGSGSGLGLAIVKRISEWHGGTASVSRSALGGALFEVRWPSQGNSARLP